jgi:hypothetical protein
VTVPVSSRIATALQRGWVRTVLALYLVGLAVICIYVPWEARSRWSRSAWDYGFIWSPPAESLTVDLLRLLLGAFALTGITLAALLIIGTTRRRTVGLARTAEFERSGDVVDSVTRPAVDALEGESGGGTRAGPGTIAAPRFVETADEPRTVAEFRAAGYDRAKDQEGHTFMDNAAAQKLAQDLKGQGQDVRVQRVNAFMRAVWAKPAETTAHRVAPAGGADSASREPAYQSSAAPALGGLPVPAHEALLLLAKPGGELREQFVDWENALPLEPGSLIPVWYPWRVDEKEMNAEERSAQFRFDLDVLLSSRRPAKDSSTPGSPFVPAESSWTAQDVLPALLELRSVWGRDE